MGNAVLLRALGEAAVIAKRNHPLLTPYAERIAARRGKYEVPNREAAFPILI